MSARRNDVQTFKGNPMTLAGPALETGSAAPDFTLTRGDLSTANLATYAGRIKIIHVMPSLDTPVCDAQGRRANQDATAASDDLVVLAVSRDLPFAQKRWCGAAGAERVEALSDFRGTFGRSYGVVIEDGPLAGLLARAVFVIDRDDRLAYQQICPELAEEPDYAAVLAAVSRVA